MKVPPESNSEPRTAPRMFENNSASQLPRILADLTTFVQEPLRKPGASVRLNPSDVRKNARSGRSSTIKTQTIESRRGEMELFLVCALLTVVCYGGGECLSNEPSVQLETAR